MLGSHIQKIPFSTCQIPDYDILLSNIIIDKRDLFSSPKNTYLRALHTHGGLSVASLVRLNLIMFVSIKYFAQLPKGPITRGFNLF